MKKKIKVMIIILICTSILINCKSRKYTEDNTSLKNLRLLEQIKKQTEEDLKKMGIKNLLFYNNGKCTGIESDYLFKNNGEVLIFINKEKYEKKLFWKVENNELFINPNDNRSKKFIKTTIKAIKPPLYTIDGLKKIKYAFSIKSKYISIHLMIP